MVRIFDLAAVVDALREHAVLVADAVAEAGQPQRRHRIEKAGGEPAEAAVAQRRIRFERVQLVEIEAQSAQRLAAHVVQTERDQRIRERAPRQKLHRQVVDALGVLLVVAAHGVHPALDQRSRTAVDNAYSQSRLEAATASLPTV